jgi:hypothetical protein
MRFLKTLTLNRRAIYDDRVALTTDNTFTVATSNVMVLPKSSASISSPTVGMMRYNTSTDEVEVYEGASATWRAIRYKESVQIQKQSFSGDGITSVFGPLSPQPPTVVANGASWTGDNLIVIVGGVFQVYNTNYLIQTGVTIGAPYDTGPDATKYYIKFTSASPGLSTPITVLAGFDQ